LPALPRHLCPQPVRSRGLHAADSFALDEAETALLAERLRYARDARPL
jgi:hypothetical protein